MKAMVLPRAGEALQLREVPCPQPKETQLLLKVLACGVCRTDVHIVDGELAEANEPLILGHQIVGEVVSVGKGVQGFQCGDRVGVPWLGGTCGSCSYCSIQKENLCDQAVFTGYTLDGGFAEFAVAEAAYSFSLPAQYSPTQAAPLLCAGLIGYRALRMAGEVPRIGFYGFGASAHILTQVCVYQNQEVFAFTRAGDSAGQQFARSLGATWAGSSDEMPPEQLDAAVIFAPVGALVPTALKALRKGGVVVCAGIHMSDIPSFPYESLWGERKIVSVANLTRQDGEEFFKITPRIPVKISVTEFPLEEAGRAVDAIRAGSIEGAAVLKIQ